MDFAQSFAARQQIYTNTKMAMVVKRAMSIQARNKIKPTSMNPNLLVMSALRGGDSLIPPSTLDLYWPSS
jgi:hypothetical protein